MRGIKIGGYGVCWNIVFHVDGGDLVGGRWVVGGSRGVEGRSFLVAVSAVLEIQVALGSKLCVMCVLVVFWSTWMVEAW